MDSAVRRWVSIVLTVTVAANFSGLYLFVLPYAARRKPDMTDESPSDLIDSKIASLGDWRGETLAKLRALIHEADPDVVEQVKWRKPSNPAGVPVWEHAGIVCTGESYKDKVKLTFAQGAKLEDPAKLFNSSLEGNTRRALDLFEGDEIDGAAFKALFREAVAFNEARPRRK